MSTRRGQPQGEGLVLGGVYELVLDVVDTSGQLGRVQVGPHRGQCLALFVGEGPGVRDAVVGVRGAS